MHEYNIFCHFSSSIEVLLTIIIHHLIFAARQLFVENMKHCMIFTNVGHFQTALCSLAIVEKNCFKISYKQAYLAHYLIISQHA